MKHLLESYQSILNLQKSQFSQIEHDDAMVAIVYKVTQSQGEQFILKISPRPDDALREMHFLHYFQDILPVPKIIHYVPPTEELHAAILMEYLPGTLLKTEDLKKELAYQIGSCLAKIHVQSMAGYGDPIYPHLNPDPKDYFSFKFEEALQECHGHLPMELIEKCRDYYAANVALLNSVDGPCIVHRDFRPGNIIVHDGKLKGIIDWAGARASFAEHDLFKLEHDAWFKNSSHLNMVLEGYASIRPIPNYQRLIPFLSLNKALAIIGYTVKCETWMSKNALVYQNNRHYLENFFKEKR